VRRTRSQRIIFITGTDTGVGKTVLTGLLLHHLRRNGCHALAMKPFCCGGTADTESLRAIQDGELTAEEVTPFYFPEPLAPLVAARQHHRSIRLVEALTRVRHLARRCECLLVEGIGGLLVPLGKGFNVRDVIACLDCEVVVVSVNRLGTLNHTLLTAAALEQVGVKKYKTVLMNLSKLDASARSNGRILAALLAPRPLYMLGHLGPEPLRVGGVKEKCKKNEKTLAAILGSSNFTALRSL
jgi:dethiobiotin synthetase